MAIGGSTIADLLVRIGADVSQLGKSLKEAEGQIQGFVAQTETAGLALGRLALLAGGVGAAIVAALALSVRAAGASQEAQERLTNAILSSGKAIDKVKLERIAQALQKITPFSDEAILSMQSLLITFGATEDQVTRLTPLLLDISARFKKDLPETAFAFGKALQGNETALRRLGIGISDDIDLLGNFDQSMQRLQRRFDGAAEAAGRTFFGSLQRLRNAFSELQEAMGVPFLAPLTGLINAFASLVNAVAEFLKQHPVLAAAVGGIISAFATLALGIAALAAVMSVRAPFIAAFQLLTSLLPKAGVAVTLLGQKLVILAGNVTLLRLALSAGLVGAIVAATVAIIRMIRADEELNKNVTRNILKIGLYIAKWEAFVRPSEEATQKVRNYEQALEDLDKPQQKAIVGIEEEAQSLTQLAKEAELAAKRIEAVAAANARAALKREGLTEADIRAIEQQRVREVRAGEEKVLQAHIARLEKRRQAEGLTAEQIHDIDVELETKRAQLNTSRLQNDREVADAVVDIEKRAAEKRLDIAVQAVQQEADAKRQAIDDESRLEALRETNRAASFQRRVQQIRVEEELRIGMLRRTVDLERRLGEESLAIRTTLFSTQNQRLEAAARINAAKRDELVRAGILTEEEARRQAAADAANIEGQRIANELKLLKERERLIQEQFEREQALAVANFKSKQRQLELDLKAQDDALVSQQKLREIDLNASVKIGQAETAAKITELQLRFEATKKALLAEISLKEKAGEIDARTAAALRDELQATGEEFNQSVAGLKAAQNERAAAVQNVINETRTEVANQRSALQAQADVQRQMLQQQFAEDLVKAIQNRNANLRDLAERAGALGVNIAGLLGEQKRLIEEAFERGEITPEERQRRLDFITGLNREVNTLSTVATDKLKTALAESQSLYTQFATAVKAQLQPIADLLKEISNPQTLSSLIAALFATGTARPGAAPAAAAPNITQNVEFAFQGVTVTLTADEQKVLERVIKRLLGAEGERLYDIAMSSQAGPRGAMAGGTT